MRNTILKYMAAGVLLITMEGCSAYKKSVIENDRSTAANRVVEQSGKYKSRYIEEKRYLTISECRQFLLTNPKTLLDNAFSTENEYK